MRQLLTALLALLGAALLAGCGVAPAVIVQGDLRATLTTEPAPPLAGRDTTLTLALSEAGAPLRAASVGLRRSMPGMEHASDRELVAAEALGEGRYRASLRFSMGGRWDVAAVVAGADGTTRTLVIPVEVEQP